MEDESDEVLVQVLTGEPPGVWAYLARRDQERGHRGEDEKGEIPTVFHHADGRTERLVGGEWVPA